MSTTKSPKGTYHFAASACKIAFDSRPYRNIICAMDFNKDSFGRLSSARHPGHRGHKKIPSNKLQSALNFCLIATRFFFLYSAPAVRATCNIEINVACNQIEMNLRVWRAMMWNWRRKMYSKSFASGWKRASSRNLMANHPPGGSPTLSGAAAAMMLLVLAISLIYICRSLRSRVIILNAYFCECGKSRALQHVCWHSYVCDICPEIKLVCRHKGRQFHK